ncbi:Non-repetitive/WGA-negative nucleoporin C-terminal-domain-containing protein [Chiua virens]|nr:Non-repetitive/WGA-negative nucleoporin C-terminal-domain-containing protein [Chiua virens]
MPQRTSRTPPRPRRLVGYSAHRVASAATPPRSVGDSGMEVDEAPTPAGYTQADRPPNQKDTIFAKTEELVVGLYGGLPVEVKQALRSTGARRREFVAAQFTISTDFLVESYTGCIDTTSGYTLATSAKTCFLWSHATLKPTSPSPTCYILPCPPPSPTQANATSLAPHHAIVPSRSRSIEPGLILVSPTGATRFWPSISSGLSGGSTFEAVYLPLDATKEEYVSCVVRTKLGSLGGAYAYLAATSIGRIFRLGITSQGGKHTLTARLFALPTLSSSLSLTRLLGWSAPSAAVRPEPGNVVALASFGNDMFALVDTRIQKWTLGTEELKNEVDVAQVQIHEIGLIIANNRTKSPNTLVLLVSYASAGAEEDPGAMVVDPFNFGPRRVYAIVRLVTHGDSWGVDGVTVVPYVANAASPPAHPRLTLLSEGAIAAVLFGEVVIFCARDTPYHDRLVLKSSSDQFLALSALPPVITLDHADARSSIDADGGEGKVEADVLMVTGESMLKVSLDVEKVQAFKAESLPNLLRATLKQAILYSPIAANPLQFILPPSQVLDGEALMRAAEGISTAVIASDAEIVRANHDLTYQITARKERLSWLIRFINDNGALGKMSQRSRQRLAIDAEKLYACHQLWVRLNEHIDAGALHSLITDTIHAYIATHASSTSSSSSDPTSSFMPEQSPTQDVTRDFFKHRVSEVGKLLVFMVDYLNQLEGSGFGGPGALKELGGAVVGTLQAALSYRAYNLGVYGVELPMVKPWTSRPVIIDAILKLVDSVTKLARESGASNTTKDVVNMLPEVATLLFACVQERLDWLASPMAADDPNSQRDRKELEDKFAQLRPEVLETLRVTSHLQQALALATTYTDFPSLASLLLRPTPYPPASNPQAPLIQNYLSKYGDAFGSEVVRWCIEQGEARVVFAEESVWGPIMDKLFAKGWKGKEREGEQVVARSEYNAIAWVNDMGRDRFGDASRRLLGEASSAGDLGVKHFMLSLGKLCQFANLQEGGTLDETMLDAFHDGLDFIAVQEKLLADFRGVVDTIRGKQKNSLDAQVDAVLSLKAKKLKESERRGLVTVFKNHVRDILQRKVLNVEGVVDVLTLKDNMDSVDDYATALHLLARAKGTPDVRRLSSFRRAWCRVYYHDDWDAIRQTANVTDAQLKARFYASALYHTLLLILPTIASTSPSDPLPEGFDLDPSQCLPVPLMPETSSRFPGMPDEMVGGLARDFRTESSMVEKMRLDDVYFSVRELAMEELGYEFMR